MIAETRVIYQWLRFEQLDQWWHWLLLASVIALGISFVGLWYRRDTVEQHPAVGWALLLLRLAAFTGLLLYFLQLDKRTEQRVVRDSRVAILVDTSLSMSQPGTPSTIGVSNTQSRAEEVAGLLAQSDFLKRLAQKHQLAIYRFDQLARPGLLGALEKSGDPAVGGSDAKAVADGVQLTDARWRMLSACSVGGVAMLLLIVSWGAQIGGIRAWPTCGWLVLAGARGFAKCPVHFLRGTRH